MFKYHISKSQMFKNESKIKLLLVNINKLVCTVKYVLLLSCDKRVKRYIGTQFLVNYI